MKVFLGGTVATSKWRDWIMPRLQVAFFNPVVDTWNEEAYQRELYEREHCEYCLYVLTPKMEGHYAVAEVIDDSFKRPDRTIYCYLPSDGDSAFTPSELTDFERIGQLVSSNGAVWLKDLQEIADYLNSANTRAESLKGFKKINHVFISYGRRHSLAFANQLHNSLVQKGYDVWFDMNDIPLGVDFQQQIDEGIRRADNFIFIISPHSVKSIYCYKEIILALKYNKRIIPVLHIEPTDCWDKIHPVIAKLNWIYARQIEDFSIELAQWLWKDEYEQAFLGLHGLLDKHKNHVRQHTLLLDRALQWELQHRNFQLLLTDRERINAQKWLKTKEFRNEKNVTEQAPCFPTDLHCEFIAESKQYAQHGLTQVFLSYAREDSDAKELLKKSLLQHGITSWTDTSDIKKGEPFQKAIERGVEQADAIVFLISPSSIQSEYCILELEYAAQFNKRIIPLLIEETLDSDLPSYISSLQYINFVNRTDKIEVEVKEQSDVLADVTARSEKTPYQHAFGELLNQLNTDKAYYKMHKHLLVKALRWQSKGYLSLLMNPDELTKAQTWLKQSEQKQYQAAPLHYQFIEASEANAAHRIPDVYIAYSADNLDFAAKLNRLLEFSDKITWFQEYTQSQSLSEREGLVKNGIESTGNFIFIISPESVQSSICIDELKYANSLNKRVLPVLYKETVIESLPIKGLPVIDFVDQDFDSGIGDLLRALDYDKEYMQKHVIYQQKATEWKSKEKSNELLLKGEQYVLANNWLHEALDENKKPKPTELHEIYVVKSGEAILLAEKRERKMAALMRFLLFASVAALLVALYFVSVAVSAKHKADENASIAKKNEERADSAAMAVRAAYDKLDAISMQLVNARSETDRLKLQQELERNRNALLPKQEIKQVYVEVNVPSTSKNEGVFLQNGRFGYRDTSGKVTLNPQYESIEFFKLARVKKGNLWGVADEGGNFLIPVQYPRLDFFDAGKALFSQGDKWGYLDLSGDVVVSFSYAQNPSPGKLSVSAVLTQDSIFESPSKMPEYPGGLTALQTYLATNMKYPKDALNDSIQGMVLVKVMVDTDGSLKNIQLFKSVYKTMDEEAIRLVQQMPTWIAGEEQGEKVRTWQTIPVRFKL